MRFDCIIFDLDGTVLYTIKDLADSINYSLIKDGLVPCSFETVHKYICADSKTFYLNCLRAENKGLSPDKENACYMDFRSNYNVHLADKTYPYEGIPHLLDRLRKGGIPTAVISNKNNAAANRIIDICLPGFFTAVIGEGEGLRPKPYPDMYLHLKNTLAFSSPVYVGDSEFDLRFAASVGCPSIGVSYGYRDRAILENENSAIYIADSVSQLENFLFEDLT